MAAERQVKNVTGAPTSLRAVDLSPLIETEREDVLSVSLDVDPSKPEHQGTNPAYRIWLRNALRELPEALPKDARRALDGIAQQVLQHVETNRPRGRGWALFAAPGLWQEYVLPVPLPNRAEYGRPDVVPVLWATEEYEPYAILAVDRGHARILIAYLGRAATVEEEALELDTTDWRFKAGRPPTATGRVAGTGRGAQRDTFDSRVEEHIRRFWGRVAEAASRTLRDLHIERLIIGGPEEAANAVRDMLPEYVRGKVVGLVPLPAHADRADIEGRTLPIALEEEHRRERELVSAVLDRAGAGGGAVVGAAATLAALQHRRVHTLVLDRDLAGSFSRCTRCGHTHAADVAQCAVCGGPTVRIPRAQVLPLLARRSGARVEFLGGTAAESLRPHDGLGAILRPD